MAFKYRSRETGREAEFTREQPDLEASPDWKRVETGDGLPARAPNPGVLDAPTVLSERRGEVQEGGQGYEAGAAVDLGTAENPGVDVDDPKKDTVNPSVVETMAPVKSATRVEWDEYATSRGLTPADYTGSIPLRERG